MDMDYFKETRAGLDRILALLHCVNCSNLPKEKLYTLYQCSHKYCEECVRKVGRKTVGQKCTVCKSNRIEDEEISHAHDEFTTNILHEVIRFQAKLNEHAEGNAVPVGDPMSIVVNGGEEDLDVEDSNNPGCSGYRKNTDDNVLKDNDEDLFPFGDNGEEDEDIIDDVGVARSNTEMENQMEDIFNDPFDSDDHMIVATQIRRSIPSVKPKKIFTNDKEICPTGKEKEKQCFSDSQDSDVKILEVGTTECVANDDSSGSIKPSIPKKSINNVILVETSDEEIPPNSNQKINLDFEKEKLKNPSDSSKSGSLKLAPKTRLSTLSRKTATSTSTKQLNKIKDTKDANKLSESLPVETPIVSASPKRKLWNIKSNQQAANSDGIVATQKRIDKSQITVKPKNIFFPSKAKTGDNITSVNEAGTNDLEDPSDDLEKDEFLREILHPPQNRVPFKLLKSYSKSSKPKVVPRLNIHLSDSEEEDTFSTPQQPPKKKSGNSPPDLTPYTNKSYSPVRNKRRKIKSMCLEEGGENISTAPKNFKESIKSPEKLFDFGGSPSPPPLTPHPIQLDGKKNLPSLRCRPSRKRGSCGSSTNVSDIKDNTPQISALKTRSVANGKPVTSKLSSAANTKNRAPIISTPKGARGRRSISNFASPVSTVSSNASTASSTSNVSSLTPGTAKRNAKGETLLHVAARKGDVKRVTELIASGIDINATDFNGFTALHEAVGCKNKRDNVAVVEILCAAGCNVNVPAGDLQDTPLHEASKYGLDTVVSSLLQYKASTNIRNTQGLLPKDVAYNKEIQKLIDDAVKSNKDIDPSLEAMDDPVVLKIEQERAVIYFAYNVPANVVKGCQQALKIKVSKDLRKEITHIVFSEHQPNFRVPFSFPYLFGLMNGAWMITAKWIEDSLKQGTFISPKNYEMLGCEPSTLPDCNLQDGDGAPKRARENKVLGHPGLFQGMNFLFYKSTAFKKIGKKDLVKVITIGDGKVINREPNPDTVDPMENPTRFHAQDDNSKLVLTSHVILFDQANEPTKKLNMEHVKSLNIKWLIDSSLNFKLLDPEDYIN